MGAARFEPVSSSLYHCRGKVRICQYVSITSISLQLSKNIVHPARTAYLKNPNLCKNCNKSILPRNGEAISVAKIRKFCSQTCSAIYNNSVTTGKVKRIAKKRLCEICSVDISNSKPHIKICPLCNNINKKNKIELAYLEASKETKGHIFKRSANWQSARTTIRVLANKNYDRFGKVRECKICKYNLHVEISHIRAVSDFPDDATIAEINKINNLVALCPTHHWEFDNGYLEKQDVED